MRVKQNDKGFAMLKTATRPVQVKKEKAVVGRALV